MVFSPTCRMIKRPTNLTPKAPARLMPVRLSQNHQGAEKGLETNNIQFSLVARTTSEIKSSSRTVPKGLCWTLSWRVLNPGKPRHGSKEAALCEGLKLQASPCERK